MVPIFEPQKPVTFSSVITMHLHATKPNVFSGQTDWNRGLYRGNFAGNGISS